MKRILILTALVAATALAHAQDITGDWQGTLSAGGDLRLVLHITKAADNSLKATLDSIDQPGANGIPVHSVTLKDSKLNLGIDAVHGTYVGTVAADGRTISGTWSQGQSLPLDFKRATAPNNTEHKQTEHKQTEHKQTEHKQAEAEPTPAKPSDIDGAWLGTIDTGAAEIKQFTTPWFRYFLTYDPAIALRKVTCPVLAINGEKDKQVLPSQNLPPIRKALEEAGNKHFEVDKLPGLNHLFQTAKTGSPAEYMQIEETMSPLALEKMATWILQQ